MRNNLDHETSPYLQQHRDNPVHWQAWGPDTLDLARQQNKPILLSIGYAACHWCHVMAHESFENPDIAAVMNDKFVNIKVDREERPDIDQIYQYALALLGEQGGWPLTMFLTPDGNPFWGGTYFPPDQRYGRPAFPTVLHRVREVFDTQQDVIDKNTAALLAGLAAQGDTTATDAPDIGVGVLDQVAERILQEIDPVHGGINGAPKFPQTSLLELLWRAYLRTEDDRYRDAVSLSLTQMCQGGIYDHLGGGFARYSTDAEWLAPHFEKMLYDNALLLDLLVMVWQEVRDPLFAQRIEETFVWLQREMLAEGGGFAATLDADSEGVEGKFYVWDEAEIDQLLGADADAFKAVYDVQAGGNWEGHSILNRRQDPALGPTELEDDLRRMRQTLLGARDQRIRPGWDDKVLADWNGLMIAAMANAAAVFDRADWHETALAAYRFVRDTMVEAGRLQHSARHGDVRHAGMLDDYANMTRAALTMSEMTGEAAFLEDARAWSDTVERHFLDDKRKGYYFTANDAEALITRTRNIADNATPAGNATMLGNFTRLWHATGEAAFRDQAQAIVHAFAGELAKNFFPLSSFLNAVDLYLRPVEIVLVSEPGDAAHSALRQACLDVSLPNRVFSDIAAGTALPQSHPAAGMTTKSSQATVYVCVAMTCSAPITDANQLRDHLTAIRRAHHEPMVSP